MRSFSSEIAIDRKGFTELFVWSRDGNPPAVGTLFPKANAITITVAQPGSAIRFIPHLESCIL